MKYIQKHFIANKHINDVFDIIYNNDENIFSKVYAVDFWEKCDWVIKRNIKQKSENMTIYLDSLPDKLVDFTTDKTKQLVLKVKSKVRKDLLNTKKIKTRVSIMNINPIIKAIITGLHLIKIKMVVDLQTVDENKTSVNIQVFVSLFIPEKEVIEAFIEELSEALVKNLQERLMQ
jgi:oligoribonuclease NrnB/cAMP/cGMP phosphodiesterase (DHH superfamily)